MYFFKDFRERVQKKSRERRARKFNAIKDRVDQPALSKETQETVSKFIEFIVNISNIKGMKGIKTLHDGSVVCSLNEKELYIGFIDDNAVYIDPLAIGLNWAEFRNFILSPLKEYMPIGSPVIKIMNYGVAVEVYKNSLSEKPFITLLCEINERKYI